MSKVELGSSIVGNMGVSCPRVSSSISMMMVGVGLSGVGVRSSAMRASLLSSRAAGRLVIERTNFVARGAREGSLLKIKDK